MNDLFLAEFKLKIFVIFSPDENKRQVQDRVQRPPEAGAGEGVPLQPLHHHQEEGGAGSGVELVRETGGRTVAATVSQSVNHLHISGQNLVPEPPSKGEETSEEEGRADH